MCPASTQSRRAGFTLIEVVTSLVIMSVLMLGLSGAVMVGAHAIPTETAIGVADQEVIDVLNQLRSDFREASSITTRTSISKISIMLAIKSNSANGAPQTVMYFYDSTNESLVRQMDDHGEVIVLDNIEAFEASFTKDADAVRIASLFLTVRGTIQQRYEVHAALPAMPEEK